MATNNSNNASTSCRKSCSGENKSHIEYLSLFDFRKCNASIMKASVDKEATEKVVKKSEENEEISEYEKLVKQRCLENHAFLLALRIEELKGEFAEVVKPLKLIKKRKVIKRSSKVHCRSIGPVRRSARLVSKKRPTSPIPTYEEESDQKSFAVESESAASEDSNKAPIKRRHTVLTGGIHCIPRDELGCFIKCPNSQPARIRKTSKHFPNELEKLTSSRLLGVSLK